MESRDCKFSDVDVDVLCEKVYEEVANFIHYLAWNNSSDQILMQHDEIEGEMLLELVKGVNVYAALPMEELKAVIRKMMDNRIYELRSRYYATHRKATVISLNEELDDNTPLEELISDESTNELLDSRERVAETRSRLSPVARRVFDAVIYGNSRLATILYLSTMRASNVYKSKNIVVKPWMLADALLLSEKEVRAAIKEIKLIYAEVCNECE